MTPADITAYAAAISAPLAVFVPLWLKRRSSKDQGNQVELVNWQSLNASIVKERDELRRRLDSIDAHYIERIKQLDADYQAQMVNARHRIASLEAEVAEVRALLRRNLGGG